MKKLNELSATITAAYENYTHRNNIDQTTKETVYSKQDALQDSMLKLLEIQAETREQITIKKDAKNLLHTTAKNCKIDLFRKNSHATAYTETLKNTGDTFATDKNNELRQHIINNLTDEIEKTVFVAYYIEEKTGVEIAESLDIQDRQAQRLIARLSKKIEKMNIAELIDTRFAVDIAGAEHHTCTTPDSYYIQQVANDWELWNGQSDFSDYTPAPTAIYNQSMQPDVSKLNTNDSYVYLKHESYKNMADVDMS